MKKRTLTLLLLSYLFIAPTVVFANHELWIAVSEHQWEQAHQMIKDGADPDYIPQEELYRLPNQGASVFWWVLTFAQWDLAKYILEIKPQANVSNAPNEGWFLGVSVSYLVASAGQRDLFTLILKNNPETDLDTVPPGRKNRRGSIRQIISYWKDCTVK